MLSGDRTPISGNSSATITVESPIRSSTLMSLPSGTGTRLFSLAPRTSAYHAAARAAPRTTMCALTVCIPSGMASVPSWFIDVLLSYGRCVGPHQRVHHGAMVVEGYLLCPAHRTDYGMVSAS